MPRADADRFCAIKPVVGAKSNEAFVRCFNSRDTSQDGRFTSAGRAEQNSNRRAARDAELRDNNFGTLVEPPSEIEFQFSCHQRRGRRTSWLARTAMNARTAEIPASCHA